ncbi:MAG: ABC transporter permease subunit, partial [Defluviitaleaceae bacterium]|nr:ABC transporter permease subunit [Defluviitaleaceae bacterium]
RVLPIVLSEFRHLDNPDVIWVPLEFSALSFRAAIRISFGNFTPMMWTVLYAAVTALIQIVTSAMAGYALGRVDFPFKKIVMAFVLLVIIVPPQALLIPQFLSFHNFDVFGLVTLITGDSINLINNPATLYLLSFFGFGVRQAIFIFIFRQFFAGLPAELEEAALIDGCGFYKTFIRIAFPNAIPAMMTVFVLSFVWNYGDTYLTGYFHPQGPYLANSLSLTYAAHNQQNLLQAIARLYNLPMVTTFVFDAVKHAAALIYLVPLLVIYFATQKKIVDNFERSGIVG